MKGALYAIFQVAGFISLASSLSLRCLVSVRQSPLHALILLLPLSKLNTLTEEKTYRGAAAAESPYFLTINDLQLHAGLRSGYRQPLPTTRGDGAQIRKFSPSRYDSRSLVFSDATKRKRMCKQGYCILLLFLRYIILLFPHFIEVTVCI